MSCFKMQSSTNIIVILCCLMFVGAITSATIHIDGTRLLDRNRLQLAIEGVTTGAQATSVTWRRNGNMVTTDGGFFVGGGDTIHIGNPPCESQMYRVALQVDGS